MAKIYLKTYPTCPNCKKPFDSDTCPRCDKEIKVMKKYVIYENDDIENIFYQREFIAEGNTKKEALLNFAKALVLEDNNFILETRERFEEDRKELMSEND
jgi:predicted amidophosphoribosyltransferase